jgi:hypothetical protein
MEFLNKSKRLNNKDKALIRSWVNTKTIDEIVYELDTTRIRIMGFLRRNNLKTKEKHYFKRDSIHNKLSLRYYRILNLIKEIDTIEKLKGGWRQISIIKENYEKEKLIDALLDKREQLIKQQTQ